MFVPFGTLKTVDGAGAADEILCQKFGSLVLHCATTYATARPSPSAQAAYRFHRCRGLSVSACPEASAANGQHETAVAHRNGPDKDSGPELRTARREPTVGRHDGAPEGQGQEQDRAYRRPKTAHDETKVQFSSDTPLRKWKVKMPKCVKTIVSKKARDEPKVKPHPTSLISTRGNGADLLDWANWNRAQAL